ncbi:hypothetical protein GIB67_007704 [Kingdonia uniflora]|uniref:Copper transport protein n=1 Tax=Kingdonia uniflora TaxID=39325 RepID=A0A7J7N1Q3_9MAGN|nr:hypothetical protein GIB67_007704 [Kingdonia uniflora]
MADVRMSMMMHTALYWGKAYEILFKEWPRASTGMYVLALVFVFVLGMLVELLSHYKLVKPGSNYVMAGVVQTIVHAIRVALAFLIMLALMSFNVGVFLVAVAGRTVGYFFFGSGVFR